MAHAVMVGSTSLIGTKLLRALDLQQNCCLNSMMSTSVPSMEWLIHVAQIE